jgi:hypothetical protein
MSDEVNPGMKPGSPTSAESTAVGVLFTGCIEQLLSGRDGLWWCIGHMACVPCPQVHPAARSWPALAASAAGTSAIAPSWQTSQMAASGASARRSRVITEPR